MKKFSFFIKLTTLLFLIERIAAPSPILASPPLQTTATWTGFYFANRNLQGSPVFIRNDSNIAFNWGGSPGAGLPVNDFSVRWIRWVFTDTPGNWTYTTITADGVRLFIDDAVVIDSWLDQSSSVHTATINLTQTFHLVRMEYYNHVGNAQAHLQILSPNFPDWRGEYYSNPDLAGAPLFARNDGMINFNFGTTGPGGGISGTNFSARWTRGQYFNAGRYRFTTTTDDGVRVWVDNQLIIDHWVDQVPRTWSGEITLTAGNHLIKMEYFQHDGAALAVLTWSLISSTAEIWHGEYFDNPGLYGAPALSRDGADVNFSWGTAPPGPGIPSGQNWSARWASRKTTNLAGFYTVIATADDGVRVWVDDSILIDQWHDEPPTTYAAIVFLNPGPHDWRVEFYQHLGAASLRVQITPGISSPAPGVVLPANADVIVDDGGAGFFKGGLATAWRDFSGGYGGHASWMQNDVFSQASYNWARWYPALPQPGFYEVSVYIPANPATTRNARYWIQHAGTYDSRRVNQSLYTNQWVALGAFYFSAGGGEYVSLANVTYEPFLSTALAVDAVKFTPR